MNPIDELKTAKIEVLSDMADLYPYAFDTAPIKDNLELPLAVAFPKKTEDVQKIVHIANKHNLKIISRGAGTCHTSGCKPSKNSLVIHFAKMNQILEINKENLTAIVYPGVIVGQLQKEVGRFGLFFPPDPSNLKVSTVGGAAALSSGGPRTFKYGTMKDYVLNLEIVDYKGDVFETGKNVSKNVTGYNLTNLFVGSEGTLGIITKITLKLIQKPLYSSVTMAYFDSLNDSIKAVNNIIDSLLTPSTIDLLDKNTIDTIEKFNPQGWLSKEGMLLVELDGITESEIKEKNEKLVSVLNNSNAINTIQSKNEIEAEKIWNARRSAFACCAKLKPNVITEDIVVPRQNIVPLVKEIQDLCKKYDIIACIMGHAGDGNIHPNFALDLNNKEEKERFLKLKDELFDLALKYEGTLSGEHGIGQEKKSYLTKALGETNYNYMKQIKKIFDPNNIFNPELLF